MKKRRRVFSVVLSVFVLSMSSILTGFAKAPNKSANEASYDLQKGGTQTFQVIDSHGIPGFITVSEEINPVLKVSNGTYKVAYTSTGCWDAGFKVTIKSNKITSAYAPYVHTLVGNISSANLKHESSTQASFYFRYSAGLISKSTGVRGYISGTSLKVKCL